LTDKVFSIFFQQTDFDQSFEDLSLFSLLRFQRRKRGEKDWDFRAGKPSRTGSLLRSVAQFLPQNEPEQERPLQTKTGPQLPERRQLQQINRQFNGTVRVHGSFRRLGV
jgi:hypothetical protein